MKIASYLTDSQFELNNFVDFGASQFFSENEKLTRNIGTPSYCAPEV
jgi:serine/threonine protein kinase